MQPPTFEVSATTAARDDERKRCEGIAKNELCHCGLTLSVANNPEKGGWPSTRCSDHGYDPETKPRHEPTLKERYQRNLSTEAAGFTAIDVQTLDRQLRKEIRVAEAKGKRADATRILLARLENEVNGSNNSQALTITQPQTQQVIVYTADERRIIKQHIAPDVSDAEFELFLAVGARRGLDPLAKQIYAVVRNVWNKETRQSEKKMVIMTSIDGYRAIASRSKNGKYAGSDDPEFGPMVDDPLVESGRRPEWAKARVYMMVNGQRAAYTQTVYWEERVQVQRDRERKITGYTGNWPTQPRTMLGKCAEAAALRKAAPEEMSGIHLEGERIEAEYPTPVFTDFIEGTAREIVDDATGEILDQPQPEFTPDTPHADETDAPVAVLEWEPATEKQKKAVINLATTKHGWSQQQIDAYCTDSYGHILESLSIEQAGEVISYLAKIRPQASARAKELP